MSGKKFPNLGNPVWPNPFLAGRATPPAFAEASADRPAEPCNTKLAGSSVFTAARKRLHKNVFSLWVRTVAAPIPYQTLISSIIHKYAAGMLIDRRSLIVSEEPAPYKVSADKKKK